LQQWLSGGTNQGCWLHKTLANQPPPTHSTRKSPEGGSLRRSHGSACAETPEDYQVARLEQRLSLWLPPGMHPLNRQGCGSQAIEGVCPTALQQPPFPSTWAGRWNWLGSGAQRLEKSVISPLSAARGVCPMTRY